MKSFIQRMGEKITGILNGFDRMLFRGSLRLLEKPAGLAHFLNLKDVLLVNFGKYAEKISEMIKSASLREAEASGREIRYLKWSTASKEEAALEIAQRDRIDEGLVCVLKSLETSLGYGIRRDPELKRLRLEKRTRRCLHLYHYRIDEEFGWSHVRLQTWFPFGIQVYINGREWLAGKMDEAGIGYERRDNCFVRIDDPEAAQELMIELLSINWPKELRRLAQRASPAYPSILEGTRMDYYWSLYQSEWATDLMFRDETALSEVYAPLVRHGMLTFSSPDVMRFLGRKQFWSFKGELITDLKKRTDGVRIKHRANRNSVKMYDKQGSVLRVETTLHEPQSFWVYRPKEGDPQGECDWRPLRKGTSDIYRRADVCQDINERYLEALAAADVSTPIHQLVKPICRATQWKGKRVRALRPWSEPDQRLFHAILDGAFAIQGFRNRDLQPLVCDSLSISDIEKKRRSAKVTRQIRLLRAHGLVRKIPGTHRYQITTKGRETLSAIVATQDLTSQQLNRIAA